MHLFLATLGISGQMLEEAKYSNYNPMLKDLAISDFRNGEGIGDEDGLKSVYLLK